LRQTGALTLPSVSASASVSVNQARAGDPPTTSKVEKSHGGSVAASMLLFDFGSASAAARAAGEEWNAAIADYDSASAEVAFSLRQAFFTVLQGQELVGVGQETVRGFQKRLDQVRGFVEVGTRTKYDLTKAQVDLGNAQLDLVRARNQLSIARAVLNAALGLAEDPAYSLEKPAVDEGAAPDLAALAAQAKERHPRLQALAFREKAASAAVDGAIADLFPAFTAHASLSWSGDFTPISWSWLAGAALDWLLYGGGALEARIDEAVAGLRVARAARAAGEQDVYSGLRQAVSNFEDARERLKISALTARQAEENLTLVQGRFDVGRASSVELTDAQVSLANARGERVRAEYDIQIGRAAVARAAGSLK
ncbi:MAG TPA: TolC family protein, partial [Planctomycetota bacterium]|nr:TolC family protein [Planctomycetota bacterium]